MFFLKGFIIGLSIAAPVGAIGVLCIRRTVTYGYKYGLFSGMGAATADGLYGSIAAFGLTFISDFLISQKFWLQLIGGVFLCYLGIKTFLSKPSNNNIKDGVVSISNAYFSTLFLTLTNPMTIVAFVGIFAGLGMSNSSGDYMSAGLLMCGVFFGSALWWIILSSVVSIFRNKISLKGLSWINKLSGLIILGFGIISLKVLF